MGVLVRLFTAYGPLPFLRSGNGPEFVAQVMQSWLALHHATTLSIDPGCPWQNGFAESFTGILRDERLTSFVPLSDPAERLAVAIDSREPGFSKMDFPTSAPSK